MLHHFSQFFRNHLFSGGKFSPSHLYLFIKGFIFVILSRFFPISSWFNMTVTAYWKHLLSFLVKNLLLFCYFLSIHENWYMIYHNLDLFYDIYNTISNIIEDKLITFYWFQIILISFFEGLKKFFYILICFIINHGFYVICFRVR